MNVVSKNKKKERSFNEHFPYWLNLITLFFSFLFLIGLLILVYVLNLLTEMMVLERWYIQLYFKEV